MKRRADVTEPGLVPPETERSGLPPVVTEAQLLQRAGQELRRSARRAQGAQDQADAPSQLSPAMSALSVLVGELQARPETAALTTEGVWAQVRGHLLFVPVGRPGPEERPVWRWNGVAWVPLAVADLLGPASEVALPAGVDPWPLWRIWGEVKVIGTNLVALTLTLMIVVGLLLMRSEPWLAAALFSVCMIGIPLHVGAVISWLRLQQATPLQPADWPHAWPPAPEAGEGEVSAASGEQA